MFTSVVMASYSSPVTGRYSSFLLRQWSSWTTPTPHRNWAVAVWHTVIQFVKLWSSACSSALFLTEQVQDFMFVLADSSTTGSWVITTIWKQVLSNCSCVKSHTSHQKEKLFCLFTGCPEALDQDSAMHCVSCWHKSRLYLFHVRGSVWACGSL